MSTRPFNFENVCIVGLYGMMESLIGSSTGESETDDSKDECDVVSELCRSCSSGIKEWKLEYNTNCLKL